MTGYKRNSLRVGIVSRFHVPGTLVEGISNEKIILILPHRLHRTRTRGKHGEHASFEVGLANQVTVRVLDPSLVVFFPISYYQRKSVLDFAPTFGIVSRSFQFDYTEYIIMYISHQPLKHFYCTSLYHFRLPTISIPTHYARPPPLISRNDLSVHVTTTNDCGTDRSSVHVAYKVECRKSEVYFRRSQSLRRSRSLANRCCGMMSSDSSRDMLIVEHLVSISKIMSLSVTDMPRILSVS